MTFHGGRERRRARRLPVKIPVTLSTVETFLDSEIMNLSKGGIFLKADITFPLGTEVDLEFVGYLNRQITNLERHLLATAREHYPRHSGSCNQSTEWEESCQW